MVEAVAWTIITGGTGRCKGPVDVLPRLPCRGKISELHYSYFAFLYTASVSSTQPNYTAVCLAAKNAGATAWIFAGGGQPNRIASDCAQQGYSPVYVNAGASLTPQTLAEQVRVAHSVSVPGQSVGSWHCGASVVVVVEPVVGSVVVVAGAVPWLRARESG